MKVHEHEKFRLVPVPKSGADEWIRSAVVFDGVSAGTTIYGSLLECVVEWEERYVLFVTDDVPFEEFLHISLLDRDFRLLDSVHIGWITTPGIVADVEIQEPDQVRFRFIGDGPWILKLLPRRAFHIPYLMDPRYVWRGLGMFTSMRLYR